MGYEQGRDDEKPAHRVWVDEFALGALAVTNAEYSRFVEDTGSEMPFAHSEKCFSHPRQPVVAVSWFEAMAYCDWLSLKTGLLFRLPSEAEWERAVRGGMEGKLYSWGDEDPSTFEIYRTGWRDERPEVAGLLDPNRFGAYNLGDNVHEWCMDWYHSDYYRNSPYRNPVSLEPSTRRASRGGSWRHHIKVSRCAARSSLNPSFRYTDYGFRVLRELQPDRGRGQTTE
jgi:formylglycine-generating enzyme